ncbi:MAG: acetate kinase [Firmicutes bacterium]|nr:acetate kinase [Bacillota bacterium]
MKVLVINAGSSSLKYQFMDTSDGNVLAKGVCERIGEGEPAGCSGSITHKKNGVAYTEGHMMRDHSEAMKIVIDYLTDSEKGVISSMDEIEAIGHRVVHGGPYFFESTLLTDEVFETLKKCVTFAPLHTPAHIMGIQGCLSVMPNTPEVLVFDTSFHQTMPEKAYMFGFSYDMYEKYSLRKYGAHGTSHRFVSIETAKALGRPIEETKIVTCHIGNGSSISAVKGGKCVDTSMGFTPLDGLLMGTRCGAVDASAVTFIMEKEGYTPEQMNNYMNKKCGLLGISGFSSDFRDILSAISSTENTEQAQENKRRASIALDMLAYEIQRYIGAYTAAMDGVDAISFAAGIGENNAALRRLVCSGLGWFGVKLDDDVNENGVHSPNPTLISAPDSKVKVFVVPTNEELMIARDTEAIVKSIS